MSGSAFGTARCLLLDRLALDVVDGLRRVGVDALLLKGPSIASWLWPGEERLYGDVDLLVSPASLPAAEGVLAEMELADRRLPPRRSPEPEKSRPWSSIDGHFVIDLHHGLVGVEVSNARAWPILWEHRQRLPIGGGEVFALDDAARTLHVVLHAVQHNRHDKPLRDLQRALEVVPAHTWHEAAALSSRLDATDAFGGGLLLLASGRALTQQLRLDTQPSVHVALRVATRGTTAHGMERLASTSGVAARTRFAISRLLPAPDVLRHRSAMARRGRPGLALSYLWRVLTVAGRSVPGFVHWRQARRAAARDPSRVTRASRRRSP